MVVSGLTQSSVGHASKNLAVNYGPLFVSTFEGELKLDIQWSTNIATTTVEVLQAVGLILVFNTVLSSLR